jgi:hypothetical protein
MDGSIKKNCMASHQPRPMSKHNVRLGLCFASSNVGCCIYRVSNFVKNPNVGYPHTLTYVVFRSKMDPLTRVFCSNPNVLNLVGLFLNVEDIARAKGTSPSCRQIFDRTWISVDPQGNVHAVTYL